MIHIKDIYKIVDLLEKARDEIGRMYGDRLKYAIPIYKELDDLLNEINKESE